MLKNIVLLSILMLSSCSTDRKVSDKVSIMLDVPVSPIKSILISKVLSLLKLQIRFLFLI